MIRIPNYTSAFATTFANENITLSCMTFATRRYSGERPTPDEILLAGQRLLRYSNLDRELRGHDDEARAILNYLVEEFDATAIWINDDTRVDIDLLMDELNQTNP